MLDYESLSFSKYNNRGLKARKIKKTFKKDFFSKWEDS